MEVLISGAGVAGLTAAYWLQQYGFQLSDMRGGVLVDRDGHEVGQTSTRVMTAEDDAPDLTADEVESLIDATTERIAKAANAIELKDYSALVRH